MVDKTDAVDDRITHIEISACQIDLGAQSHLSFFHFAVFHLFKKAQILFDGTVAVRRSGGMGRIAAVFLKLFRGKLADIRQSFFDQFHRVFIVFFKIIGPVVETVSPVEPEPVYIILDRVDVFRVLLRGICIIHAKIAQSAEFLRHTEVNA